MFLKFKMAEINVVVNDVKNGKSYSIKVESTKLAGKKIGEKLKGNTIGLGDYEFDITGGSDRSGFPMRKDIEGVGKKKILISKGIGLRKIKVKGYRTKKSVRGNTIGVNTAQVNIKVSKYGSKKLDELIGKEVKVEKEEKKEVKEK